MAVEQAKTHFADVKVPTVWANRLRKSSKKKSTFASNRIEGNPLTEDQASSLIDNPGKRHYLKPEQEIKNYFEALEFLESERKKSTPITQKFILEVQRIVVKGESQEKTGIRGPMPPGVLFAVYDDTTGAVDYIPPAAEDVGSLMDELVSYLATSDDHPVIKAAVAHYQLVTIHPFEDGNGRTARLISDYILDLGGYGFSQIGSLEEYFAYDVDAYYHALQMGLPAVYYEGRTTPPHPEIWLDYFVHMMELHANKALELATDASGTQREAGRSFLSSKEQAFLDYLVRHHIHTFTPVEMAKPMHVTNRTIINWCAKLVENGMLLPKVDGKRIRCYQVTELA